jgi:hypothetical protein
MTKEAPQQVKDFVSSLAPLQKIDYLLAVLHAQEVEATNLKELVSTTIAEQYMRFENDPAYEDMSEPERDIKSGMLIQLSNIIEALGDAFEVEDFNQWRFDCGVRICGTPQVGVCDWCKSQSTQEVTNGSN